MITYKKLISEKNLKNDEIVLDIETTGLDATIDNLVLLGLVKKENDKTYIYQYFAEDNSEEKRLLEIYLRAIENKTLITYNGDKFDIPFLNMRLVKYKLMPIFPEAIDIYKIIASKRKYFKFESMKLMDVEKHLGIYRDDPSRYKVISKLTDDIIRRENPYPIMKHNENDLIATASLRDVEEIFNEKLSIDVLDTRITLVSSWINNDIANISLLAEKSLDEAYFTGPNYELRITGQAIEINLEVLYGRFDSESSGHVALNIFDLENLTEMDVDPKLLVIRENYMYNYKNILNLSKKIIENHL